MPVLAQPPVALPRFVPHTHTGAEAGAGAFFGDSPETRSEDLASLAHDARNVLAGLTLYGELIAAPGVLNAPHQHYAQELQDIATSAARLIERIEATAPKRPAKLLRFTEKPALPAATRAPLIPVPVTDTAADLRRLQPLLAAVAGPTVRLAVATMPCAGRTALAVEGLTRILVNLVRNASDAMPAGGHIRIAAQYRDNANFLDATLNSTPRSVLLTVSDDGPGIPESLRERVFELGFSTRKIPASNAGWSTPHRRGLGLSIVRNLVETAGGEVRATVSHTGGARFEITLPFSEMVTSGTCPVSANSANPADSPREGA